MNFDFRNAVTLLLVVADRFGRTEPDGRQITEPITEYITVNCHGSPVNSGLPVGGLEFSSAPELLVAQWALERDCRLIGLLEEFRRARLSA